MHKQSMLSVEFNIDDDEEWYGGKFDTSIFDLTDDEEEYWTALIDTAYVNVIPFIDHPLKRRLDLVPTNREVRVEVEATNFDPDSTMWDVSLKLSVNVSGGCGAFYKASVKYGGIFDLYDSTDYGYSLFVARAANLLYPLACHQLANATYQEGFMPLNLIDPDMQNFFLHRLASSTGLQNRPHFEAEATNPVFE